MVQTDAEVQDEGGVQDRSVAGDFDHQLGRGTHHLRGVGPKGPSFFPQRKLEQEEFRRMTMDDPMFWATLSAAIATLIAASVALFLRELRAWLRPPKLDMNLSRENGFAVTTHLFPPGQAIPVAYRPEKSRYYHLKVSNPRRKAAAVHGVSVTLQQVERMGKDGQYHEIWSGDIPMVWRNEVPGGEKKVVGTWAESDLCSVVRDKFLDLHVNVKPNDLKWRYEAGDELPVDIVVTVQARGNEVDSGAQRWRIFWDGKWEDGDLEMKTHFHVTPRA